MKRVTAICGVGLLLGGIQAGFAQGFVNLDFEHPVLPLTPVNFQVPASNAIPGWTAYIYGDPESSVLCNTVSLCAAAVSLQGPG
jgi:hypothetical protein